MRFVSWVPLRSSCQWGPGVLNLLVPLHYTKEERKRDLSWVTEWTGSLWSMVVSVSFCSWAFLRASNMTPAPEWRISAASTSGAVWPVLLFATRLGLSTAQNCILWTELVFSFYKALLPLAICRTISSLQGNQNHRPQINLHEIIKYRRRSRLLNSWQLWCRYLHLS